MAQIITVQKPDDTQNGKTEIIKNSTFFPDINLSDVREVMRLDGTVTHARLTSAVVEAMTFVNQSLKRLKDEQQACNIASMNEMAGEVINGENIFITRYKRAVYCYSVANIQERYASFDLTREGEKKGEIFQDSINDLRRDGQLAIRDLLGVPRITAALI
ncbi:hypothetical protein A6A19_00960 [Actinobacillus delphinicola]|uniref:head completion/stabilization protein n=1 Tax=Actinobacillus delphinicola TaxID=51161 RepID=UPI002441BD8F|nr:head completion/stabilization protein [Actinobacillus delphinicola]MDG6896599.1 hypothetical protein [Actinobacillus delphinicola]